MQNKLISNREMFKQLLARDILAVLEDLNAGTWADLCTVRGALARGSADVHYAEWCTREGYSYLDFNDRFYRAVQSINNKGYGLTVCKDKESNRLFVFNSVYATQNRWQSFLNSMFSAWTVNYNR